MPTSQGPFVSDSSTGVDSTNTQLLLFAILQAIDPSAANLLPDDIAQSVVGNETLG